MLKKSEKSKLNYKTRSVNLHASDGEPNSSSSSSTSQNVPPPAKKKALDILFGQEERSPAVLNDEVELYFSENTIPRGFNPVEGKLFTIPTSK